MAATQDDFTKQKAQAAILVLMGIGENLDKFNGPALQGVFKQLGIPKDQAEKIKTKEQFYTSIMKPYEQELNEAKPRIESRMKDYEDSLKSLSGSQQNDPEAFLNIATKMKAIDEEAFKLIGKLQTKAKSRNDQLMPPILDRFQEMMQEGDRSVDKEIQGLNILKIGQMVSNSGPNPAPQPQTQEFSEGEKATIRSSLSAMTDDQITDLNNAIATAEKSAFSKNSSIPTEGIEALNKSMAPMDPEAKRIISATVNPIILERLGEMKVAKDSGVTPTEADNKFWDAHIGNLQSINRLSDSVLKERLDKVGQQLNEEQKPLTAPEKFSPLMKAMYEDRQKDVVKMMMGGATLKQEDIDTAKAYFPQHPEDTRAKEFMPFIERQFQKQQETDAQIKKEFGGTNEPSGNVAPPVPASQPASTPATTSPLQSVALAQTATAVPGNADIKSAFADIQKATRDLNDHNVKGNNDPQAIKQFLAAASKLSGKEIKLADGVELNNKTFLDSGFSNNVAQLQAKISKEGKVTKDEIDKTVAMAEEIAANKGGIIKTHGDTHVTKSAAIDPKLLTYDASKLQISI